MANGKLVREGIAKRLWVQPASGDAGGALGAALLAWHRYFDGARDRDGECDTMQGALLGPEYSSAAIAAELDVAGAVKQELGCAAVIERVAEELARGAVVGWFDGRMEFGPRALGARSILVQARRRRVSSRLPQVVIDDDWRDALCGGVHLHDNACFAVGTHRHRNDGRLAADTTCGYTIDPRDRCLK